MLNGASFSVHPGWPVGLIGRNGTGKTSLLALVSGEMQVNGGDLRRPADWTLTKVPCFASLALDHVLDGDAGFRRLERAPVVPEAEHEAATQAIRTHGRDRRLRGAGARGGTAARDSTVPASTRRSAKPCRSPGSAYNPRLFAQVPPSCKH